MSIGVAIIGSGIWAREQYLPAVLKTPQLSLKAVWSRSLKSAKLLQPDTHNVELYSEDQGPGKTYLDLLKHVEIQAVILALPIHIQDQYIKPALSAGKHVLSEKPMAKDVKTAKSLLENYDNEIDKSKVTWCVAENARFFEIFRFARNEIEKLGRVLGFKVEMFFNVGIDHKVLTTDWRLDPQHQGGLMLDGGVHIVGALRILLGPANPPTSVSAMTLQQHEHLKPVDHLYSIWDTKMGVGGSFCLSSGTTLQGRNFHVACENGSVAVIDGCTVVVNAANGAKVRSTTFPILASGIDPEVQAWADSLITGKPDERFAPMEGFIDLYVMEKILESGQQGGIPKILKY